MTDRIKCVRCGAVLKTGEDPGGWLEDGHGNGLCPTHSLPVWTGEIDPFVAMIHGKEAEND